MSAKIRGTRTGFGTTYDRHLVDFTIACSDAVEGAVTIVVDSDKDSCPAEWTTRSTELGLQTHKGLQAVGTVAAGQSLIARRTLVTSGPDLPREFRTTDNMSGSAAREVR